MEQSEMVSSPASPIPEQPKAADHFERGRLNLPKIIVYIGAFLLLTAFTIFVGKNWQETNTGELISVIVSLVVLLGLGLVIKRRTPQLRLPGDLLVFAGIGMIPLLIFSIIQFRDLFPNDLQERLGFFDELWRDIRWELLSIEIPSLLLFVLALALTRFSLHGLLINLFLTFIALDSTIRITTNDDLGQRHFEVALIVTGIAATGIGLFLDKLSRDKGLAFWFYLFGLFNGLGSLFALINSYDSQPKLIAFFFASLLVLVGAALLKRLIWAIAGAFGTAVYVTSLASTFEGSDRFTFSLAGVGITCFALGIAYVLWGKRLFRGALS